MDREALTGRHEELLHLLEVRFKSNMGRHKDMDWTKVRAKLENAPQKLQALHAMEETGGEPDVVGYDPASSTFMFYDCAPESPIGRRNLCYDGEALERRKKNKPRGSALQMAASMGIAVLTGEQYRGLQALGKFDTKTSSWIATPEGIRKLGGALFGDRRYDHVFIYHNGAESYYASRGFRGSLSV